MNTVDSNIYITGQIDLDCSNSLNSKESDLNISFEGLLHGLINYIVEDKLQNQDDTLSELLNNPEVKSKYAELIKEKVDILGLENYAENVKKVLKIERILITEYFDNNKHYQIKLFNDTVDYNITITPLNFIKLKLNMSSDIIFYLKGSCVYMEYGRFSEQKLKNKHIHPKFRNEEKISEVDTYMSQYLSEQFNENHFFSGRIKDLMISLSKLSSLIIMLKAKGIMDEIVNIDLLSVDDDFFDSLKLKHDFDIQKLIEDLNI